MATHHARNCTVVVCSDRRNRRQHLCQRGKSSPSLAQPYLDDRVRFLFSPASQAWQPPEHEQARLPPRLERPPDRAMRVHSTPPSLPVPAFFPSFPPFLKWWVAHEAGWCGRVHPLNRPLPFRSALRTNLTPVTDSESESVCGNRFRFGFRTQNLIENCPTAQGEQQGGGGEQQGRGRERERERECFIQECTKRETEHLCIRPPIHGIGGGPR